MHRTPSATRKQQQERPPSSRPSSEQQSRSFSDQQTSRSRGERQPSAPRHRAEQPAHKSSRPKSHNERSSSLQSNPKGKPVDLCAGYISELSSAAEIIRTNRSETKAVAPLGPKLNRSSEAVPHSVPRPRSANRVSRHHSHTETPSSSSIAEASSAAVTMRENGEYRRSMSLPVDVVPYEEFPEGGRRKNLKHQKSASIGNLLPLIRSVMRVTTQFNSLKTKGIVLDLTQHKRVEFTFLEVREYPVVLGDNPSVTEGPPITIDWGYDPSTKFVLDINSFERMRGNRRPACDLVLPRSVREQWLLCTGTTQKEIADAIRQCRKDKHSRAVSVTNTSLDPVNESIEKVTSGLKKIFSFRKTTTY